MLATEEQKMWWKLATKDRTNSDATRKKIVAEETRTVATEEQKKVVARKENIAVKGKKVVASEERKLATKVDKPAFVVKKLADEQKTVAAAKKKEDVS